jgi:hypothetical protein
MLPTALSQYSTFPTMVGVKQQIVNTMTTIKNVLVDFRAWKNRRIPAVLLPSGSVELLTLCTFVSAKMRFRCFRAIIKIRILRINIKVSGM